MTEHGGTCNNPEANRLRALALARKYVWWKPPDEALGARGHFLAHVMTYGTVEDVRWMVEFFGEGSLRAALKHAPPGVLNSRSWYFWHLRLGVEPIPPLPKRRIEA
jgi:hypothetical protein